MIPETKISVEHVTKRYLTRNDVLGLALSDVSLDIKANEFVSIVGRSGCGKTTLLNMIAGLIRPTEGVIKLNGNPISGPGLDRGMVFQNSALFPWLTTIQNIEFGPKTQNLPKDERRALAQDLISLVHLEGFEDKFPRELSGGMQQRVAIARALAMDPDVLLMDEPFGALDELTRAEMQSELLRIWEARKKTVIFITHSISEAIYLSDRVIVLSPHPGEVREIFDIDMPRPRRRSSAEVIECYERIHSTIV